MLAHDFGNGVALMRLLRLLCIIMLGLLLWAEISLKNRKILLILPKIGSLGGVLQQISLYNELVRKHACVSNSAG
jgi:hypothetical protein